MRKRGCVRFGRTACSGFIPSASGAACSHGMLAGTRPGPSLRALGLNRNNAPAIAPLSQCRDAGRCREKTRSRSATDQG